MKRSMMSPVLLAASLLFAGAAMAQDTAVTPQPAAEKPAHMGKQREKKQDARIKEGVQSGELTKREAKRLKLEQRAVDRQQKKAKADGVVTEKEQKRIDRMQDASSKDIARQRKDEASGVAR